MDGPAIGERNDPQDAIAEGENVFPESIAPVGLRFNSARIEDNRDAPLLPQVWPLPENFPLEVRRERKWRVHATEYSSTLTSSSPIHRTPYAFAALAGALE